MANSLSSLTGDIRNFLDISEIVPMTKIEREVTSIGFRLPDKEFVDFFNKETGQGRVAGFVSGIEKRNKGKGDYYVLKLNPTRTFWTRNVNAAEKIREFDLISADVNNSGEAKNIWRKK